MRIGKVRSELVFLIIYRDALVNPARVNVATACKGKVRMVKVSSGRPILTLGKVKVIIGKVRL